MYIKTVEITAFLNVMTFKIIWIICFLKKQVNNYQYFVKNDKQNDTRWVEAHLRIALNFSGFKNLPLKSYKPSSKQRGKIQQIFLSIRQDFYFLDYLKPEPIILFLMSVFLWIAVVHLQKMYLSVKELDFKYES